MNHLQAHNSADDLAGWLLSAHRAKERNSAANVAMEEGAAIAHLQDVAAEMGYRIAKIEVAE